MWWPGPERQADQGGQGGKWNSATSEHQPKEGTSSNLVLAATQLQEIEEERWKNVLPSWSVWWSKVYNLFDSFCGPGSENTRQRSGLAIKQKKRGQVQIWEEQSTITTKKGEMKEQRAEAAHETRYLKSIITQQSEMMNVITTQLLMGSEIPARLLGQCVILDGPLFFFGITLFRTLRLLWLVWCSGVTFWG